MSGDVLYISYDGMLEPLGQSQVLAYLERLAGDRRIHLISFEKQHDWKDKARRRQVQQRIAEAGIAWHPKRYHKRPSAPATAYDIAAGSLAAVAIARRHKIAIVHARSYVAALVGLAAKKATGAKLLFDMRGFWPDERVDGGIWPRNGRLYRAAKRVEDRLLRAADQIVTLTHASADELCNFPAFRGESMPVTVVPTCADLERFCPPEAPPSSPFKLGYVGSLAHWYRLDDMLRCYAALLRIRPDAELLIVTRDDHQQVRDRARELGVGGKIETFAADFSDVPRLVRGMSAAMALYQPSYSRIACAPTKLGEYLGSGVPCLGSAGVGDMQAILDGYQVGCTLHSSDDAAIDAAVTQLLDLTEEPDIAARCRRAAEQLFSLDEGIAAYRSIYDRLAGP